MEIEDLKKYMAKDQIEKVLAYMLSDNFKENVKKSTFNRIIVIAGRYNEWKKSKLQNAESFENLNIEKQKIRISLIESIDSILETSDFEKIHGDVFFEKYIEPVHTKFMLVHANWIDSFFSYREMIELEEDEGVLFKKLIDKINLDILLSSSLRACLKILFCQSGHTI